MTERGQAFRAALDRAIAMGQLKHLAPVLAAVREADIGCIQLRPADPLAWVLNMGSGDGWVCLVGDDRETSSGPGGFNTPSLVQVLERASAVAVYSGAADAKFYTTFAAAAVLGGTQSLHTNSRDEALALPTEESVRIALRTQQIVAYESGLADVVDPLAGSYYIEALTSQIEQECWDYIKKIDEMGGAVAAIEKGYIQAEIQESAYRWQTEVESKQRIIVGVNQFQIDEKPVEGLLRVDESVAVKQNEKLAQLRANRDNASLTLKLAALEEAAQDENKNLMPFILEAVKDYGTIGEICGVLRKVFGEYEAHINL